MSEYFDQYEGAARAIIAKEARDKERREAKAEAMKQSVTKGLAAALKNERIRQGIAKGMMDDLKRSESGYVHPLLARAKQSGGQTFRGYNDSDDIITGMEERPWESDPFDPWNNE